MNNNRGNNRRRTRGNARPQGGGQQTNRIDSRARGNAPQLLEKYRKLAQDAHMNGDRVQAEYYLQFADHYFRVIADARVRQEEARARRDERWQEQGEGAGEGEEAGEFSVESDFPTFDTPPVYTRREREEREGGQNNQQGGYANSQPRRRDEAREDAGASAEDRGEGNVYEPTENPFLRENNKARGLRPRRDDGRRDDGRRDDNRAGDRRPRRESRSDDRGDLAEGSGLEAALPPSISATRKPVEEAAPVAAEEAAPKRRTRKKPASDAGEALENA